MTNIGSSGGIAYQPGVCGPKQYRTAVVKSYSDQKTAEVNYYIFRKYTFSIFLSVKVSEITHRILK